MNHLKQSLLASLICGVIASSGAQAEESSSFVDAIKDGKTSLNFRFRVEDIDVDPTTESTATTLRTRLTHQTGSYNGFGGLIEFDNVEKVDNVNYTGIADFEGSDLNQAYISYKTEGNLIKAGRQRILLDNQRFVGGVGWRQNEQTYDGLSVKNSSVDNLDLFVAYVNNVNRIFGDASDHKNSTALLNTKYSFSKTTSLTGYYYGIDNETAVNFSTDTFGLRYSGKSGDFGYTAELASQSDAGDSTLSYSATYSLLEGSYKVGALKLKAGYEVLGADGANGQFITPLATLHAFQGWTDKFLGGGSGNIAGGIEDLYFNVGSKFGPVTGALFYHALSSNDSAVSGMDDLGTELGLVVKGKAGPLGLLFKYASYSADDFETDTDKLWLMATISF